MTCCGSSITLPYSSVRPSQDWPLFTLPRALCLAPSGPKLYTDHKDRLLLPEQYKVLFICLLAWITLFCFCLCVFAHTVPCTRDTLPTHHLLPQEGLSKEGFLLNQLFILSIWHENCTLRTFNKYLLDESILDSQAQCMVPNCSFIHLLTHSFICGFHFIFTESSSTGCSSYGTHEYSPTACCNILPIL